jgi:hypothetical protein
MSKRIATRTTATSSPSTNNNNGALAAGAGTGLVSGAGGSVYMACPPTDTSFFCKFMRFIGIIKGILFLIVLVVVMYFLWQWYRNSK